MANGMIKELETMVAKLQSERQEHVDAIAEIDAAFGQLGIDVDQVARVAPMKARPVAKAPAKAAGATKPKGRTGIRYPMSGSESILAFVRKGGKGGVSGGEIDKHWKSEGRAGSAYNIMGQLVSKGKLKREEVPGQRGSSYIAV